MQSVERGITREALRACPARLACMPRLAACLLLSVLLALVPLEAQISNWDGFGSLSKRGCVLSLQKSEARANPAAGVAAGAALSALAVELGISETTLMAAIAVSAAGATGIAVNMALDPQAPPAPGFKPWDDLTPEEKGIWGDYNTGTGTGGDIETYQKNAIGWWALQYGMLETGDNGGYQPSSEPDPEQDPEGHSKWVKARNAMIALGAGGAAVAFNDAVSPLIDNASAELRALLFGADNSIGLGLTYECTLLDADNLSNPIRTAVVPCNFNHNSGVVAHLDTNSWFKYDKNTQIMLSVYQGNPANYTMRAYSASSGAIGYQSTNYVKSVGFYSNGTYQGIWNNPKAETINGGGVDTVINAVYSGTYTFPSGATLSAGVPTGFESQNIDYGQMVDTPEGLEQAITQPNQTINNFYNDYTNAGDGNYRGIAIPSQISTPGYVPEYPDLINTIDGGNYIPIPDDTVYPGTGYNPDDLPNPDPDPNPGGDPLNPNPNWNYPDNIGDAIDNLGNAVFDQLFPFCLIGDIRRLCEKFNPAPQNVRMLSVASDDPSDASQYSVVIPLSDFNIDGVDDLTFEMGPVFSVALMVRPWWTVLFAAGLIAESVRYFLK